MNGAIAKLTKQNKQIDSAVEKAKEAGKQVHGIDEDEYAETAKQITKLTKEKEALNNIVRKRVGKQDIVTKTQIGGPKKQRGRPKKEPVEPKEKRPKGRPKKEQVEPKEKKPRGRPKKEAKAVEAKPVEDVKVDVKQVAKEVVSKNLKSIVDEIIKEHTHVKVVKPKQVKPKKKINPKLPMKITKFKSLLIGRVMEI